MVFEGRRGSILALFRSFFRHRFWTSIFVDFSRFLDPLGLRFGVPERLFRHLFFDRFFDGFWGPGRTAQGDQEAAKDNVPGHAFFNILAQTGNITTGF